MEEVSKDIGRRLRPALPMNRAVFHRLGLSVGIAIALAGCGPRYDPSQPTDDLYVTEEPPVENQPVASPAEAAEALRERQIQEDRQSNPALNWVSIGITTGKFSESIGSGVYKTYEECVRSSYMEDNTCFPIASLPESYWDAESERTGA